MILTAGVSIPFYASEAVSTSTVSTHATKKKSRKSTTSKSKTQASKSKTRVLGNTYVANYELDGISVCQGIRFDSNGRLTVTTQMFGQQQTNRGTWSQDGKTISTNTGVMTLDDNGNLHQGNITFYRK